MAVTLDGLIPEFKFKVEQLLTACRDRGIEMIPFYTVRTPYEQAKLWRQSRPAYKVYAEIAKLRTDGAHFLAACLESVGPQHGPQVTNALPGFSWHQWGEAVDCYWMVDGSPIWDAGYEAYGLAGYSVYAGEARKLGLRPGIDWKDAVHVQLRHDAKPQMSIIEIDQAMRERFG